MHSVQCSSFPDLGLFGSHIYFTPGYRLKEQNLMLAMSTRGRCCQHLNLSITIVLSDRSEEPVDHLGFLLIIVGTLPVIYHTSQLLMHIFLVKLLEGIPPCFDTLLKLPFVLLG